MDLGSMSPLAAMDRAMANTTTALASAGRALLALLALAVPTSGVAAAIALHEGALGGSSGPATSASAAEVGARGSATAALPQAARAEVSAALGSTRAAFQVHGAPGSVLRAGIPGQGLSSSFARSGVTLGTHGLDLKLSLSSAGFGEGAGLRAVSEAPPTAEAHRVTYSRGALSEWYANGPAGLEQGFTIARPPASSAVAAPGEPLTLTLALATNASPRLTAGGASMILTRGSSGLSYGSLSSTDANGRALRTWLQLQAGRLLIHVDAAQAAY